MGSSKFHNYRNFYDLYKKFNGVLLSGNVHIKVTQLSWKLSY